MVPGESCIHAIGSGICHRSPDVLCTDPYVSLQIIIIFPTQTDTEEIRTLFLHEAGSIGWGESAVWSAPWKLITALCSGLRVFWMSQRAKKRFSAFQGDCVVPTKTHDKEQQVPWEALQGEMLKSFAALRLFALCIVGCFFYPSIFFIKYQQQQLS